MPGVFLYLNLLGNVRRSTFMPFTAFPTIQSYVHVDNVVIADPDGYILYLDSLDLCR